MAIILRDNTSVNTGKGGELTYSEMDANLESFYYSSSIAGANLYLHTTGSITHTVDLSGAIAAGAQGAQGVQGTQGIQGIQGRQGPSIQGTQGIQGTTGTQGTQGAIGNPGGSDTQVQFNDGGTSFGGDSGLTYDKTANRLTITAPSSPNRTSPNLLLNSELSGVTDGEVFGVIAANNTTDQYSPANYPASIQFTAEANFAPGVYDAGIRFYTNDAATEKEALRLINTGQNRLPQYGTGTFTGTAAKWLAVDSSGNVIEEDVPSPGGSKDYTRSTEVTHTVDTVIASLSYRLQAGAGNTGYVGVYGLGSPASSISSAGVDYLLFNVNDDTGIDRESTLKYLCNSTYNSTTGGTRPARVTLSKTVGQNQWTVTFNIEGVTKVSNYYYVFVSSATTPVTLYADGFGDEVFVSFDSFAMIPLQDNEWNRITVTQQSAHGTGVILQPPPTWQSAGKMGIVEIKGASGTNRFKVWNSTFSTTGTYGNFTYSKVGSSSAVVHHDPTPTFTNSVWQYSNTVLQIQTSTAYLQVMSTAATGTNSGMTVLNVSR